MIMSVVSHLSLLWSQASGVSMKSLVALLPAVRAAYTPATQSQVCSSCSFVGLHTVLFGVRYAGM